MFRVLYLFIFFTAQSFAQLMEIADDSLSNIDGQADSAVAWILDDVYATGQDVELKLDFDSGVPLLFTKFYWVGHDSVRSGADIYGVDLGSYQDPLFINLQDEQTILENGDQLAAATLVVAFPEGDYKQQGNNSDLGKSDIGTLMTLEHASGTKVDTWLLFNGIDFDNTYLKFWGDIDNGGLAISGELNLHADEIMFQTKSNGNQPSEDLSSAWRIENLDISLALGHSLYQPITLEVNDDQHLVIELAAIDNNTATQFYNETTGNISASNITINDWDTGSASIGGVQLQHLRIETHDLN